MSAAKALLPHLPTLPAGLKTGRELLREQRRAPPPPRPPTGLEPVDRLLAGGLPRGRLVELTGRRSCGRFAIVLAALAAATGRGEQAALVDLGDHLDPREARRFGIRLERLLWLRPTTLKQALVATEIALAAGLPLVVLDLGEPSGPGRRPAETSWVRLARAAEARRSALLVSTSRRMSATAAAVVVGLQAPRALWTGQGRAPRLLTGIRSRLRVDGRRDRRPGGAGVLLLRAPANR